MHEAEDDAVDEALGVDVGDLESVDVPLPLSVIVPLVEGEVVGVPLRVCVGDADVLPVLLFEAVGLKLGVQELVDVVVWVIPLVREAEPLTDVVCEKDELRLWDGGDRVCEGGLLVSVEEYEVDVDKDHDLVFLPDFVREVVKDSDDGVQQDADKL